MIKLKIEQVPVTVNLGNPTHGYYHTHGYLWKDLGVMVRLTIRYIILCNFCFIPFLTNEIIDS
jgi:hypothetical protein